MTHRAALAVCLFVCILIAPVTLAGDGPSRNVELAPDPGPLVPPGTSPTGDGRIRIFRPVTITEPGSYVVTRNIVGTSSNPVVRIASSNVQVDLGGFTFRTGGYGAGVIAENVESIVVENGNIIQEQGENGIGFYSVRHFSIRHLVVTKTDFSAGGGILLSNCENGTVEYNTVGGAFEGPLWISGSRNVIARHNVLSNTDCEAGVYLGGDALTLADNLLDACSSIHVSGSGNKIVNNDVRSHSWYPAITVNGSRNRIEGNTLVDNPNGGLWFDEFSSDNFYSDNFARGNGLDFRDEGTNNTSHGDNYMPDKM